MPSENLPFHTVRQYLTSDISDSA